jgi:hypothetical protein
MVFEMGHKPNPAGIKGNFPGIKASWFYGRLPTCEKKGGEFSHAASKYVQLSDRGDIEKKPTPSTTGGLISYYTKAGLSSKEAAQAATS